MSEPSVERGGEATRRSAPAAASGQDSVLQYVVDNVPALIFWKDRDGVFRGCNKRFAALDGKSDPAELVGKTDYEASWKELADVYRAVDLAVMESGVPVLNMEEILPDGSGGEKIIVTSKVPMRDEEGRVTGILGVLFDITERKRMEIELGRAKEEAEQAAIARSNFIANVSHELRTPLTLILGPVKEALADPRLVGGLRELIECVQRNGFRLYNLVNDVLDFAKGDAGRTAVRYERLDVAAALAALVDDMRPLATARRISLELAAGPGPLRAELDPKLFERSVLNLVSNALKFTPAGGTVRVTLEGDGDRLRVDVADTGIGIAEADLGRLFQPFSQLDSSATRKHEGTGLGLALVKQFVEAMGGSASVVSQPGRGSTFTIRVPRRHAGAPASALALAPELVPEPDEDRGQELGSAARQHRLAMATPEVAAAPDAAAAAAAPDVDPARPRVLVADDNADLRAYIARTLEGEFAVVTVENGLRAWEVIRQQPFDVVVSDVMMPELDGMSLAARIKGEADLAHVPVILVTARGSSTSAADGLDAGADDYVIKPFVPEELRARVRAMVRMARLQRELRAHARETGMAQVAAGALHNIGNVMNSINISVGVLRDLVVDRSRVGLVEKLAALLAAECGDDAAFAAFAAADPRGRRIPQSLATMSGLLAAERARAREELDGLQRHLEHVIAILASQRGLARPSNERFLTELPNLLHEGVRGAALAASGIRVESDHGAVPALVVDPHKVLQIVINLLANARDSLLQLPPAERGVVRIRTRAQGDTAVIEISDDGVGISSECLPRIFEHGFTTKPQGHGFGLHASALAAAELGGTLTGRSDGPGRGATFTLTLPLGRSGQ